MAATTKSDTCTVACKLPNGLMAELWDMEDAKAMKVGDERTGYRLVRPSMGKVFFRGNAAQRRVERGDDRGLPNTDAEPVSKVATGFGLTMDVNREWAEEWFKQNAQYQPVAKGLIFMTGAVDSARDQAKDQSEIINGLEPINPDKPAAGIEPVKVRDVA